MVKITPSYTQRELESFKQNIISVLKRRFPTEFREFVDNTITDTFISVVAAALEQQGFYLDQQAINSFLATAELPEAIIPLASQQGYKRRLRSSASVSVTLLPSPPQPTAITIRKGEQIRVSDLVFENAEDVVIPAGKPAWPDETASEDDIVIFTEGETRSEEFVSEGSPFQSFTLSQENIISGSIVVTIEDVEWEETDSLFVNEGEAFGEDTFVGTGLDGQVFTLKRLHAIIDGNRQEDLKVVVGNDPWQRVLNLTGAPQEFVAEQEVDGTTKIIFGDDVDGSAPPEDILVNVFYVISGAQKRFTADFNRDNKATINFGDDVTGLIPTENAVITVSYAVGGGSVGNIRQGAMDGFVRGFLNSGASINVRIFNQEPGSGGEADESLQRVKELAPVFAKANNRAVRPEDWGVLATNYSHPVFGSPSFAAAKLFREVPESNLVELAIWSRDANGRLSTPSTPLKIGVENFMLTRKEICTRISTVDGKIIFFDIEADVSLTLGNSLTSALQAATDSLIDLFNSSDFVKPGVNVKLSSILQAIQDVNIINQVAIRRIVGTIKVVEDLGQGDGAKVQYSDFITTPFGLEIVPSSFEITDGTQTISDNGTGGLGGNVDSGGNNTINYETGEFDGTFALAPTNTQFITAEARYYTFLRQVETKILESNQVNEQTSFSPLIKRQPLGIAVGKDIAIDIESEFLPLQPNKVVLIGGYDNAGLQPGAQLIAKDDGEGNIVGDVLAGGTVDYATGRVEFSWNIIPAPSVSTSLFGRLIEVPDGNLTSFTFEVRDAPSGGGTIQDLEALNAKGRLCLFLSQFSTPNVQFSDVFDNGFGVLSGEDIQKKVSNIDYTNGVGALRFITPPDATAGQDFSIEICPLTLFYSSAFSAYVRGIGGYEKYIYADHLGRVFGDNTQPFPVAEVDHLCGRYRFNFVGVDATGKVVEIKYDSAMETNSQNLPVDENTIPAFGILTLREFE